VEVTDYHRELRRSEEGFAPVHPGEILLEGFLNLVKGKVPSPATVPKTVWINKPASDPSDPKLH